MALVMTEEFTSALALLSEHKNVFLTGKAGTGKSTLIRYFLDHSANENTLVVAPTGIAALNVGGTTIHRLLSLSPGATREEVRSSRYYPKKYAKVLKTLDTLIVDEVSMVRADLFDILETVLEHFGPHPGRPFGGVQIVLVGDLFQLPPVVTPVEQSYFESVYPTPYFFSSESYPTGHFSQVNLTRIFRQAGDAALTEILNGIREGSIGEEQRTLLNSKTKPEFTPHDGTFWLTLTTTNRIATARNRAALDTLPTPAHTWEADICGDVEDADMATDQVLSYKVGAQVMMLVNDPGNQYVNGTLGKITDITYDTDGTPEVTIHTRDGRSVAVGPHTWEILRPSVSGGAITSTPVGTFTQLPFRLAWAITIHKSQGQTLDHLVVDLSGGTFAYGQLYVALSRAVSLDGLVLRRDVLPKDLKTDQRIRRFLATGATTSEARNAYLGISFVGKEGRQVRPRPIEIAAVFDDGTEVSTLINPTSDIYDARERFGITTQDILPAPVLAEAWPALLTKLHGAKPVGVAIDEELGYIDFELKRDGYVEQMPLGVNVPTDSLTREESSGLLAHTALERARAVQAIAQRIGVDSAQSETFTQTTRPGYLLARGNGPEGVEPGGALGPDDTLHFKDTALTRAQAAQASTAGDLAELLSPGVRVCFTGTAHGVDGKEVPRSRMENMALARGLALASNVSKTRCDVLVVAEVGTQSGKARKAQEFGKPVIAADDFLTWAECDTA